MPGNHCCMPTYQVERHPFTTLAGIPTLRPPTLAQKLIVPVALHMKGLIRMDTQKYICTLWYQPSTVWHKDTLRPFPASPSNTVRVELHSRKLKPSMGHGFTHVHVLNGERGTYAHARTHTHAGTCMYLEVSLQLCHPLLRNSPDLTPPEENLPWEGWQTMPGEGGA